jgi:glyoxylase I family protein
MAEEPAINIQGVHHIRLTVTDVARSKEFYTNVVGFKVIRENAATTLMLQGSIMIGLGLSYDPRAAIPDDRFDENRVGLDHLSFAVPSYSDLESAIKHFDAHGVSHGEIKDIGVACVLAFRDPDNIQLELTAMKS